MKKRKLYPYKGQQLSLIELADLPECQVCISTLQSRINVFHWNIEEAVITPKLH